MDPKRLVTRLWSQALAAILTFLPHQAWAATGLDGAAMRWPYALPFAGLLLSIALGPLLFAKFWHHHYGKIAAAWSLLALASLVIFAGGMATLAALVHAVLVEYLGFIVLLFSLYVVAGGVLITGDIKATPATNAGILALGTLGASVVGTTGAAMILIRPLIRANRPRRHNTHVVIFFIILVANVGGALSPLGDPPLFVGFLHGVDFFWTTRALWLQTAIVAGLLLAIFVAVDVWHFRSEPLGDTGPAQPVRIRGLVNLVLIAAIVASLLASAMWKPGVAFDILGTKLDLEDVVRNLALLAIAALSVWLTPDEHRQANGFTWEPIREVAKLFAGIFVAIIPVIAMLNAGHHGAFAWLLSAVTGPGRRTARGRLFLVHRPDVRVPRQCSDLSVVLRARRRRPAGADARALGYACLDLDGGRLHGSAHLYRQRAELHGEQHCQRERHQNAELLRLFLARRRRADPAVPAADAAAGGADPALESWPRLFGQRPAGFKWIPAGLC
ncbi:Na+/H+ antiporter NhaD/arsenite permease-like protein [Bradyrhizobium liaoningense]